MKPTRDKRSVLYTIMYNHWHQRDADTADTSMMLILLIPVWCWYHWPPPHPPHPPALNHQIG